MRSPSTTICGRPGKSAAVNGGKRSTLGSRGRGDQKDKRPLAQLYRRRRGIETQAQILPHLVPEAPQPGPHPPPQLSPPTPQHNRMRLARNGPHLLRVEDVGGVGQQGGHPLRVRAAPQVVVADHHELVRVTPTPCAPHMGVEMQNAPPNEKGSEEIFENFGCSK